MNNIYFQVDKGLAKEIQDMKKMQDAIPHYKAKVVPLGDLASQSQEDIMKKLKQNVDEIEKQYQNEDAKGWISSSGYTRFALQEKYVFPALTHLFNLKGLSEFINAKVERQCNKSWEIEYGDKEEVKTGGMYDHRGYTPHYERKRDRPIHYYIRGITDARLTLISMIHKAKNIEEMNFLVSVNTFNIFKFKDIDEKLYVPREVTFFLQSGEEVAVVNCSSSCRSTQYFKDVESAVEHMESNKIDKRSVSLLEWKEKLGKRFR